MKKSYLNAVCELTAAILMGFCLLCAVGFALSSFVTIHEDFATGYALIVLSIFCMFFGAVCYMELVELSDDWENSCRSHIW